MRNLLNMCAIAAALTQNPWTWADENPHAADDTFAAEAAALLPTPKKLTVAQATPALQRSTLGDWSAVIPWTPHIPVSAAQLPDGRLLTFASNQRTTFPSGPEFTYAATWNPATGQFVEYNHPSHDMFCGGLVMLPDGRVLVNGGRNTTVRSSIFDYRVNSWTRTPDMNDPRWYNTSVALPDGDVWTVSGSGGSGTAERWDQSSGWSRLTGINWNTVLAEPGYINIWHPFLVLAGDGRLLHFGPTDTMHWVNPAGAGTLVNAGATVPGSHYPKEGSWVMYNEGRIVVAGGGANTVNNANDTTTGTSTNAAFTVDLRSGTPIVTQTASMKFARQFANGVVLPNGEVMVMGGNTSGLKFDDTGSILTAEIWNPTTGQWRVAADASVPRNYHSLALLLPDGRVLSGGGGLGGNAADHRDAQLFTPPTLFNADGTAATRPAINTAPGSIGVGTTFSVSATAGLQKFSFIKMSAITHSINTDLRYLSLPFTEISPGVYQLTAHSSLNVMTPGYWMLFGLNAAGAHSVAKIVLVDAINSVSVAAPGNQASYVTQPTSLQMVASGPAGSVLTWSASGLPQGLTINSKTGLISGTPTATGTFAITVSVTDGITSDIKNFSWTVQPLTFSKNFANFTGAGGLTFNGNAALATPDLRLTPLANNQVGSAFLTSPNTIAPNTSLSTRFVFRMHGTADGADGMAFVIQGVGANAIGAGGGGLGYEGIAQSVAVEMDTYQGTGDPNANHLGILVNGNVTAHVATFIPGWDLEDGASHTIWVDYDGPANQLRVFIAQGNVAARPAAPVMTANIDLPATVGSQAWFGFSAATGGVSNNQDVQAWSLSLNGLALPAPPIITQPANQLSALGTAVSLQLEAADPNGDLIGWSATGLPPGLAISQTTGLITGTPTTVGNFAPTITAGDNNTPAATATFNWTVNQALTVQPISGTAVPVGASVALNAQSSGGLNPIYTWSFGDGSPNSAPSASPATSHVFTSPGRYLVNVTVRDNTGREVTSSYRQAVFAPATAGKPTATSSIIYENRTGTASRIWVVNPDNDSVTVFDAATFARLSEINVGRSPHTLALAPDGRVWVANSESSSITIIRPDFSIANTLSLPRGSRPFGVVFNPNGSGAYVALEHGGKILQLNPSTGASVGSVDVGMNVRHLSVTGDGTRMFATRFVTPLLPGEDTANPQTAIGAQKFGGETISIDTASLTLTGTIILQHSEEPDTSNSARGIPNYVGAAVISPDGLSAWAPSKQDNIKRGTLRNGGRLTHDMAMRSIASRIDLTTLLEDLDGRVDFDDGGIASASAFDPNGIFLFTALEGSREVAVVDAWARQEILRFPAGRAPQGLVLSPDGRTLFVHNFMDRTVTTHDVSALANGSEAPPAPPAMLNCVTTEKLAPAVLQGKQVFYDARDTRVAFQQYISCASCHNDGGQDGRVWDFTQFGEGLRNTITLRGHGGTAQGPLHWTGNFDEVQDFEGQIRDFAGGTGLMNDTDFHAGTRSQPLGLPKAGLSAELDALAAYVSSLTAQGDSPARQSDGTITPVGVAGKLVFDQLNCAQCHSGSQFTDSALNLFHDVGTLKSSSGNRLGAPLLGLDTPTLLGLWATAPYLHDGSAATLEAAVLAHAGIAPPAGDLANLVAYLRQLDSKAIPAPSAVVTWNNPGAITYGAPLSAAQLNATAIVPGNFAYTPAVGTILNAGPAQTLSVTFTPSDLNANSPATATVTLNVLRANLTITADSKTKALGDPLPSLTATYSGFVNGDTFAALDTAVTLNTTATATSPAGTYVIAASGASDANYNVTHVNGILTINPAASLPAPWQRADVGVVGIIGSSTVSGGLFSVSGSGADIWNNADAFHFVYQPWTGNGQITALVSAVGNVDPWAKAGVMFRQTLSAGSPHAFMAITPGNGAAFQTRIATDGISVHTAGPVVTAPYWVRLVRTGDVFNGYVSPDGAAWTLVGSETIALPVTLQVGLAVTAHNNTILCSSTFDSVNITGSAPAAPASLSATAVSSAQINLAWAASAGSPSGYRIDRSQNGTTSFAQIATVAGAAISWSDTGLAANTPYYYRVIATNSFGASPLSPIANALTFVSTIRINFQPAGVSVPSGYLVDSGATYGNRGNGYSYGWNANNSNWTRDRNSSLSSDQRYDTLIHMQKGSSANRWEIGLPNGNYSVTIVSGDAAATDSVYRVNAEGVLVVSGTPTTSQRWISGTRTVTVSDGRLTLLNGSGSSNNKVCFIDINRVATAALIVETTSAPQLYYYWDLDSAQLRCMVDSPAAGFIIESSTDLVTWKAFPVSLDENNEFTIDTSLTGNTAQYLRVVNKQ
jgi:YVTN family beta-propeller protein